MQIYRYSGPACLVEFIGLGEVSLVTGRLYSLPETGPNIDILREDRRLTPSEPGEGEPVITPKVVKLKGARPPDRHLLAETVQAIHDAQGHPDALDESRPPPKDEGKTAPPKPKEKQEA